ncbi:hypothetical protein [Roseomonas sp. BN140053]|uniref:hypothetical protein n=1 Tax=Roseomonas sp. BN140053 TaxID=3391898 RepID=UPI0039E841B1
MTTVLIWNNNMVTVAGHSYPGHASMSIDDDWSWLNQNNYVSFWPEGAGGGLFGTGVGSTTEACIRKDLANEGYAPDHVIKLSNLNQDAMRAEWKHTKTEFKRYRMLRENCSAAVARVLKAGSSAGGVYQRHSAIWTPLNVKRLALSMGGTKISWEQLVRELFQSGTLPAEQVSNLALWAKRDARHGSSTSSAVYRNGVSVKPKVPLPWAAPAVTSIFRTAGGALLDARARAQVWDSLDD